MVADALIALGIDDVCFGYGDEATVTPFSDLIAEGMME